MRIQQVNDDWFIGRLTVNQKSMAWFGKSRADVVSQIRQQISRTIMQELLDMEAKEDDSE